ncbi:hypothetical protein LCL97_09785 [Seohaeicola saemankumensis]|nr:rhodanese-like domain-containing protein [Seohaeicola saemankumensis]MCA0871118.1 hypothetical protein [Seohaeicola saemankumensis]
MFRGNRRAGAARYALVISIPLLLGGGAALADDFGGSFGGYSGGPSAPAPSPTQPPPAQSSDGFGGSFDTGAGPAPVAAPAPNDGFGSQFDTPQPEPAPDSNQDNAQTDGPAIDPQIQAFEGRDYGVQPTAQLRSGRMHAPTPTSLPGAAVVSTQGLAEAIESGMDLVLIDVLGSDYSLPDALMAPALANSGHFRDRLQQQAGQWLQQVTGGETDMPIVLYCSDPMCWLSYNATLRTVAAGYTNVYWYRGGLQAWQMAGLRLVPAGF